MQIKHGFMHDEGQGAIAIDQKGGGKNLAQTRLYIFPDTEAEILHLITIGDKRSQKKDDVPVCRYFVNEHRKRKDVTDEKNTL